MFHNMVFRTFCHATESEDKVRKALATITGSSEIRRRKAEGYHGNPIIILESDLSGKKLKSFMGELKSSGILKRVLGTLDDRMDDECVLYLRFDKQKVYQGQLEIVEHEDVIASKLKLRVFPPKKDIALKELKEYFEV